MCTASCCSGPSLAPLCTFQISSKWIFRVDKIRRPRCGIRWTLLCACECVCVCARVFPHVAKIHFLCFDCLPCCFMFCRLTNGMPKLNQCKNQQRPKVKSMVWPPTSHIAQRHWCLGRYSRPIIIIIVMFIGQNLLPSNQEMHKFFK